MSEKANVSGLVNLSKYDRYGRLKEGNSGFNLPRSSRGRARVLPARFRDTEFNLGEMKISGVHKERKRTRIDRKDW